MTTPTYTEDALIEFKRLVRTLAGVNLNQTDAAVELDALRARYGKGEETDGVVFCGADPGKKPAVTTKWVRTYNPDGSWSDEVHYF